MVRRSHDIVVVGGGTAGISVAARLRRAGEVDVAVIEPSVTHYYQPLWTLVGGGMADARRSARPESSVMPKGVTWIRQSAVDVDPERRVVVLESGDEVEYRSLVMATGIQLNWDGITNLDKVVGRDGVSSNYAYKYAPATWEFIQNTTGGSAVFAQPSGPIKCAGAPQKIAYLAADYWRSKGVLDNIDVHLVIPTPAMFGVKEVSDALDQVVKRFGITVHLGHEITEIDPDAKEMVVSPVGTDGPSYRLPYNMAHMVPPQSAPDWVKKSALADPAQPLGYIEVDKHTLQHPRYPDVFALGDSANLPTSKTGAAIRKQAPAVVENLLAHRADKELTASYNGYTSCPLVTSRKSIVLAEFDYTLTPTPSLPYYGPKEVVDAQMLKLYGLPTMYWNGMLRGLA